MAGGVRLQRLALLALPLVFLARTTFAALPDGRLNANMRQPPTVPRVRILDPDAPVTRPDGTVLPPYNTTYYFDQLIDHNNPSLGTFKQRYWHTYEFYESGGPIILSTPGEGNADGFEGYLTNRTINGQIAQQQKGSTIVLEHRFYGLSNPLPDLSVKSLRLHTLEQAVEDLVYFANNVQLPMPGGDQLAPGKAPWILIGGSYSGALTSWTMVKKPGVFHAGYASSAVVEAILDFWAYFEPVRINMPKNCSADVQAVVAHVDQVLGGADEMAIKNLKNMFGLGQMTHLDDVAGALRNNLWDWQSLQPTTGPGGQFYQFCDALEVKNGVSGPVTGWGLDHALTAWSSYFKNTYYSKICGTLDAETCLGTYNASSSYYTDISVDNAGRSWFWIVCNEVGYLQEGAPQGYPSIVTRLVQPDYDLRQCHLMFPEAFSEPPTVAATEAKMQTTNTVYHGWDVNVDRLFFANGVRDPWKDATVSATNHPVPSTDRQPIGLGDGFHCSDLGTSAARVDPTIADVQAKALSYMKTWLAEWTPSNVGVSLKSRDVEPFPQDGLKPINALSKDVGTL